MDDEPQWTLELTDRLLQLDASSDTVYSTRKKTQEFAAGKTINATVRNYCLSCANTLEK